MRNEKSCDAFLKRPLQIFPRYPLVHPKLYSSKTLPLIFKLSKSWEQRKRRKQQHGAGLRMTKAVSKGSANDGIIELLIL